MNNTKIDTIHFFGCSFTALESSNTGYNFTNYRKIIEKELDAMCINHSHSGKSNQHIFDDIYNVGKDLKNTPTTLFIIQTTFLDRFGFYSDIENNKFVSICKSKNPDDFYEKIYIDFYNQWLKYFYSRESALKEFEKQTNFLCSWLRETGIRFYIIGMDESLNMLDKNNPFFKKNNFISFENEISFYSYSIFNELRIVDILPDNPNQDYHFNQKGHNILAESILNKIKNDKKTKIG